MPARSAMVRVLAPSNPFSANSSSAASRIARLVTTARACSFRLLFRWGAPGRRRPARSPPPELAAVFFFTLTTPLIRLPQTPSPLNPHYTDPPPSPPPTLPPHS